MKNLATHGTPNLAIKYTARPTVKVIITKDDMVLLLNDGLLPGGGVDTGETDLNAVTRELQEELGTTVKNIAAIGSVIQYRNFLNKKYIVNGYKAELSTEGQNTSPQDEGEANFTKQWLTPRDALVLLEKSISLAELKPMDNDYNQGRLYNLMTSRTLLKELSKSI